MFDASILAFITNIVRLRKPLIITKKQHWQQVRNYSGDENNLSTNISS